jgi:UDP-N-acetylmuramoylalanine--D-glutamate ligase
MKNIKEITNTLQNLAEARKEALALFAGIRYRYEKVTDWKDIEFINDSKSTDLGSSLCSLDMTLKPIHWIVGEATPGDECDEIFEQLKFKVISVTVLGKNDEWMWNSFKPLVDEYKRVDTLSEALTHAVKCATPGSVVLFSPACSSYDLFENYQQRGEMFNAEINKMIR